MRKPSGLAAILLAVATFLGAVTTLLRQIHEIRADQRRAWDNLGEYTVPEIEALKERLARLEKQQGKP